MTVKKYFLTIPKTRYIIYRMAFAAKTEEKIYANALSATRKMGPKKMRLAREYFGSFQKAWTAPKSEFLSAAEIEGNSDFRNNISPEKEFDAVKKENAEILLFEEMPEKLRQIPDAPEILYIKGRMPSEENIFIAFVGTRKCTSYGEKAAEEIISGLKNHPVCVVSGLALGIDAAAHRHSVSSGIPTIAVLGSGISRNTIYPKANISLADKIIEHGGCVISEYPVNQEAAKYTFPQRNRIVAGLSSGTVVIEAPQKSGAIITAFLAIEYSRDVFAVPGTIFSPNSKGCHNLLKMGAVPVTSAEDILIHYGMENKKTKSAENITANEMKMLSFIKEPTQKDKLIRTSGMKPGEINPLLTSLEIKGIIKEIDGILYY
jgi:DNA processing protein